MAQIACIGLELSPKARVAPQLRPPGRRSAGASLIPGVNGQGAQMVTLRQVQWIAAGEAGFLTGIGDLVLVGEGAQARLYAVSRHAATTGGLTALAIGAGGQAEVLNALALPRAAQVHGPAGIALVGDWPAGQGLLLVAGAVVAAGAGAVLLGDGQLDRRLTTVEGAPADLVAVASAGGQVFGLAQDGGAQAWTVQGTGLAAAPAGTGPAANLLAAAGTGTGALLVAASTAGHRLDSYTAGPGAAPVLVQSLGIETGLGIGAPAALEIVSLAGRLVVLVAGTASSSLSVLDLSATGRMTPLFHAMDTLHSRFEGAAALASVAVAGRVYVAAGGGDDGISLFLLLPSGRLVHLAALAWQGDAPGNVTALAMQAVTAADGTVRLDIFAGGESPGLARIAAHAGALAPPQQAGALAATLTGGAGADLLLGGSGAVTLAGGAGDDILIGGTGPAVMTGGDGADLFVPAQNGQTTRITDFAPGADRIDLSGFAMLRDFAAIGFARTATGARLSWQGTTVEVISADGRPLTLADFGPDPLGGAAALPLPGPEPGAQRHGTADRNRLTGGEGGDTLWGWGGNDTLTGLGGDDLLIGGEGNDLLRPGPGQDTIWAGPGDDRIELETGPNEVWAGPGRDTLIGGTGDDILGGGADDDLIDARAGGRNQLWGAAGNDTLWSGGNGDMAGGGSGDDIVNGGAGGDQLYGGLGNDTVHGNAGADVIYLGAGNDQGHGGAGDDTILAGPGFDRLWGGDGADQFEFWRAAGWTRVEDFDGAEGDVIALGRGLWTGSHGALTAQQVVNLFGSLNASGDAVLNFAAAGTTVVIVGAGTLAGLADDLVIL